MADSGAGGDDLGALNGRAGQEVPHHAEQRAGERRLDDQGAVGDFGLTRRELLWQAGLWLGPETDNERTGGRSSAFALDASDDITVMPVADSFPAIVFSEYRGWQ